MSFSLASYLARVNLSTNGDGGTPSVASRELLGSVMAAQSRLISFENLDCVLRSPIDVSVSAIENKLVKSRRGGYCFEQNTLLLTALRALGFHADPLLCRVRWNKEEGIDTPFTHLALRVRTSDGRWYLADVGFAGTNSIAPVELLEGGMGSSSAAAEGERLPEGLFRAVRDAVGWRVGYTTLQWHLKGAWRNLYCFRSDEVASEADMAQANFWSYAHPSARFTSSFFAARVVGDERHHILNDSYCIRRDHEGESKVEEEVIGDKGRLSDLLVSIFGIDAPSAVLTEWEARFKRA